MNFKIEAMPETGTIKITVRKEDKELFTHLEPMDAHILSEGIKCAICACMGDETGGGRQSYEKIHQRYREDQERQEGENFEKND